MNKILGLILMFLAIAIFSNAQQADSSKINQPDSAAKWFSRASIPNKEVKVKAFIVPAVFIGYGFAAVYDKGAVKELDFSTKNELQEDHPRFAAHVDDYLQFAPAAAVYALNLSGVKGKHNLFDASMMYLTAAAIMGGSTHLVKQGIGRIRPDQSGSNSFPSGHTASAFMAAEFLHQEYKDSNPWIAYAGYFVSTATGTLRMYNNKHWFSDVIAGAGFGIASTKIAYLIYPYIKRFLNKKEEGKITLMPFYQSGSSGIMLSGRF